MKMISYWKKHLKIHSDEGLIFIIGWYDHKHQFNGGEKSLGVHWTDYPQSRGVLSPCVIPETTRSAILSGLLHQAISDGNVVQQNEITKAIEFFHS